MSTFICILFEIKKSDYELIKNVYKLVFKIYFFRIIYLYIFKYYLKYKILKIFESVSLNNIIRYIPSLFPNYWKLKHLILLIFI
jgi:hypothetical protein